MQRTKKRSLSNKSSPRSHGKKLSLEGKLEDLEISAPSGSGEESAVCVETFWKVWNDVEAPEQDPLPGKKHPPSAGSCDSTSFSSTSSESYSEFSGKIKTSIRISTPEYEKQKEEDWQGVKNVEDEEMDVPDNSLSSKSDDTLVLYDQVVELLLIELEPIESYESNGGEKEAALDEAIKSEIRDQNFEKEEFLPAPHSMSDPDLRALTKNKREFDNITQLRKTVSDRNAQDNSNKQYARNQLNWMGKREYGSFIGSPSRQQAESSPVTIAASEHRSKLTHSLLTFGKSQVKKITGKIKHSEEQIGSSLSKKK